MTHKNIKKKVFTVLINMGIAEKALTEKASFIKDLGLDSLDFAELLMELEATFSIDIPMLEAENMQTVQEVVSYIGGRVPSEMLNEKRKK